MPTYNFKKDIKVYVVRNGFRSRLDIYPDISFSQTFDETAVPVKTLHSQFDMFQKAVITKANPANFNFTIPILKEADLDIVMQLLVDYDTVNIEASLKTADLYVENSSEIYKLEKIVMESGTFQITRDGIISLSVSGTARKLQKVAFVEGIPVARSDTRTYTGVSALEVSIDGVVQPYISNVSVELRNEVQWLDYTTLQNSLVINDASGTSYPEAFVVSSRVLSGNVQQYVTDESNSKVNTWSISKGLRIRAGRSSANWFLDFNIPSVVYTNRLDTQELYMQSYDWRMNSNPGNLSSVITHITT